MTDQLSPRERLRAMPSGIEDMPQMQQQAGAPMGAAAPVVPMGSQPPAAVA